jgi:cytosine/uracil/thiamine/allantoin permease
MNTAYSALTGLNAIIGLFSSLAVNMPDFGRFSRNRLAGPHQFLALPIIGTLGALTPIFVTDAHSYLWGEFEWQVFSPDTSSSADNVKVYAGCDSQIRLPCCQVLCICFLHPCHHWQSDRGWHLSIFERKHCGTIECT